MEFTNLSDAQDHVLKRLLNLAPAGAAGFEGAVAAILSEITGQRFAVTKSGHQDGSDARNDPCNSFRLAMEAKRYKEQTGLARDELLHKITEAERLASPPDLWILATTKSIDASTRDALHA